MWFVRTKKKRAMALWEKQSPFFLCEKQDSPEIIDLYKRPTITLANHTTHHKKKHLFSLDFSWWKYKSVILNAQMTSWGYESRSCKNSQLCPRVESFELSFTIWKLVNFRLLEGTFWFLIERLMLEFMYWNPYVLNWVKK